MCRYHLFIPFKAKAGRIYKLTLNFANGGRIYADATVVGAADPAPSF